MAGVAALLAVWALAGCGVGQAERTSTAGGSAPAYVTEAPTRQQELVREGAQIAVMDGCTVCHLMSGGRGLGPSFTSLAGHRVTLVGGRTVLVDEKFVTEVLTDPRLAPLRGYDPHLMGPALARLRVNLRAHPHEVQALAAFIEEIGPED
jgi:hypothetical protein